VCSRLQTTKTSSPRSEAVDEPSSKSQQDHCLPSFLPPSPSVPTSSCRFPVILAPSIRPPTCRVQVGCFRRTYFPNKQRSFCLQYESTGTTVEDLRLIIRHGPLYTTPHCVFVLAYAACCSVHIKTQTTYLLKHRVSIRLALLLAEVISAQGWGRHVWKIFLGCRTLYSRTYTHIHTHTHTHAYSHTYVHTQTHSFTHTLTLAYKKITPTYTRWPAAKAARMHEELRSHWGPRARLPAVDAKPPPLPKVNLALCTTMPVKKKSAAGFGSNITVC